MTNTSERVARVMTLRAVARALASAERAEAEEYPERKPPSETATLSGVTTTSEHARTRRGRVHRFPVTVSYRAAA